jgi:hypothetical protein
MFFSYLLFSQAVFACETGFACSISNLEQVRSAQEHLIYKYIDNLFKKEINENYFLSHPFYTEDYDDLFLFKSIF